MTDWYECEECSYGTNSPAKADAHETEWPGHVVLRIDEPYSMAEPPWPLPEPPEWTI